ncbi:hypothetical protein OS493_040244, partial [Desmophyllum pertusum]
RYRTPPPASSPIESRNNREAVFFSQAPPTTPFSSEVVQGLLHSRRDLHGGRSKMSPASVAGSMSPTQKIRLF